MMKSSNPGIWFVGRFLITLSTSELVIDLYIYILFFSWFSLETLYLFVHFFEVVRFVGIQLLIVWSFVFLWCPLLIFPFSSLILFIWVLSMFYLMNLAKVLSVLFISQRTSFWFHCSLLLFSSSLFIYFCSDIYDFFFRSTFLCSFSSCFSCNVRLFIWDYFYFLT